MKDKMTIGILAHVDAGKTTLSEGILYLTGQIRKLGRVDHQDAFLDNFALERARGITIFSKQALFELPHKEVTLLDTPGHVDFSAEMERTLQVLDYAILVISGADGVQGHTQTLWKLLRTYHIPTFLFVNKMDQNGTVREELLKELKEKLDDGCIVFDSAKDEDTYYEEIAMTDEDTLEQYMEEMFVDEERILHLVKEEKVFPVYFGSALKLEGVEEFLEGLDYYTMPTAYNSKKGFGAKVFKISRGDQGERLTHLKITSGSLKVKTLLEEDGKVDQIRIYHGSKYELMDEAPAGTVCAVTGLSKTAAGQGMGSEKTGLAPVLEPVLAYQIILPEGTDLTKALRNLKILQEEEPLLHVVWNSHLMEIHVQLMGEVQTEILKSMLKSRFDMDVEFGPGKIMYKETIEEPVIGIGHYEPLRHYAEAQLLMEPGEPGSGLEFKSRCSEDLLDKNWQRLILTHLAEKEHIGVLMGMPITDMKISIIAGRAHQKHTEGGDFRQATYRAIRQGLKKARSVLLEPWYDFQLEVPSDQIGRAMTDIQKRNGTFESPLTDGETAVIKGTAPAATMQDYQKEVWAYSKGKGRLTLQLKGYYPCHNTEEVLEASNYDSDTDLDNPTGSVFCAHGAGYLVPWDRVDEYAHIKEKTEYITGVLPENQTQAESRHNTKSSYGVEDAEFLAIYEREFGKSREKQEQRRQYAKNSMKSVNYNTSSKTANGPKSSPSAWKNGKNTPKQTGTVETGIFSKSPSNPDQKQFLLVDGYNIIFAWEELKTLAEADLGAARLKLMDILGNYQGFTGYTLILVFDAYKVENNPGEIYRYHNIYVVFTKEAETADQYIEKTTHEIGKKHQVIVATSDNLEQVIVMGQGATRITAMDFYEEIERVDQMIRQNNHRRRERQADKNYLLDYAPEEIAELMEEIRLGKKQL